MHSYWALSTLAAERREALIAEVDAARLIRRARQGRHDHSARSARRTLCRTRGLRRRATARQRAATTGVRAQGLSWERP